MTKQADLIAFLFEKQSRAETSLLSARLFQWMEASAPFTAFVDTYRDKIRKKIRVTREPGSVLDVLSELEIAYSLLTDRRFTAVYEPYASEKRRGPDFSVTYRANLVFNIEVARIREEESEPDARRKEERIQRITLGKLSQMQPGMPNLLAIQASKGTAQSTNLANLMQAVKTRVDGKDSTFYAYTHYENPADFYKHFNRLSGILLWVSAPETPAGQLWVNKQSKPEIDEKVLRLVSTLVDGRDLTPG